MSYGDVRDLLEALPRRVGGDSYMVSDLFPPRHRIAQIVQPRSVFEFGAYYGYFLVTMLDAAPSIERVGWIDDESYVEGSNEACLENIRSVLGRRRPELWFQKQVWRALAFGQADIVHVDGDHSYEGCMRDLVTGLHLRPSVLMVDDSTAQGDVIYALRDFSRWLGLRSFTVETVNGLTVFDLGRHGLRAKLRRRFPILKES